MSVTTIERLTVTLPSELLARLNKISAEEDRPRSSTVRRLLRRALAETETPTQTDES